jgi:hypothetical protein
VLLAIIDLGRGCAPALALMSSREPLLVKNYQPNKIGQDTIWHSAKYPSALILPTLD